MITISRDKLTYSRGTHTRAHAHEILHSVVSDSRLKEFHVDGPHVGPTAVSKWVSV